MRSFASILIVSACTLSLAPAASAQPHRRHHQIARAYHGAPYPYAAPYGFGAIPQDGAAFNAGAAGALPPGFYNGYEGPGATVLRRGVAAQYEPGATQELEPDARQTATGGPVGGLPGRSGP